MDKNNMTAVEWLEQQLKDTYDKEGKLPLAYTLDLVKQAKQMEKEQMIEFAEFVASYPNKNRNYLDEVLHAKSKYDGAERTVDLLEEYYNETYGQEREYLKESTCEYSGLRSVQSYEDLKK